MYCWRVTHCILVLPVRVVLLYDVSMGATSRREKVLAFFVRRNTEHTRNNHPRTLADLVEFVRPAIARAFIKSSVPT